MEKCMIARTAAAVLLLWAVMDPPVLVGAGPPPERIEVARFSKAEPDGPLPEDWKPQIFKKIPRHTDYRIVTDNDRIVVSAESRNAASGLVRTIAIDPARTPILQWQWKISGILKKGNVTLKSGDDYPARIYVTFAYDPDRVGFFEKAKYEAARILYGSYPPAGALAYIWANKAPRESLSPNPYTDRVKMIAVQSGEANAGTWITESRNIVDDYQAAFGEPPPMISGIAIMTDTDNTGESATAWYGDIVFLGE
ncbi:MAG: DUF3047 domain-containing protein [Desulfobacterales bacterium]|nr:DUF3047 domain-containing protein [Desulfobacterales bacterium]